MSMQMHSTMAPMVQIREALEGKNLIEISENLLGNVVRSK